MALDPGVVIAVVLCLTFVAFVAWAEIRSRLRRRSKAGAEMLRNAGSGESPPSRKS